MSINEHNYEHFFLLYVDDELSAAERQMVQDFVSAQPHLQAELELLKEAVLLPGDITMDKTGLYKKVAEESIPAAMMIEYLDEELDGEARQEFEKQLQASTGLQAALATWQRAKLDANEHIPFPGKSVLYRREPASVLTMRLVKWAVAAALVGAGFFAGINYISRQDVKPVNKVALQQPGKVTPAAGSVANNGKPFTNVPAPIVQESLITPRPAAQQAKELAALAAVNNNKAASIPGANKKEGSVARIIEMQKPGQTGVESGQVLVPIASTVKLMPSPGVDKADLVGSITGTEGASYAKLLASNAAIQPEIYTRTALLNEGENDNHIFLMEEDNIAHTKAGAFFKKLKRTVARTASIKTGNSLKIAGFEFAVK